MRLMQHISNRIKDLETKQILNSADDISEIRLRTGRPLQLVFLNGSEYLGECISPDVLRGIISSLMDNSLYSREKELRQGYFTTAEGCRVGVCGKTNADDGHIHSFAGISSVCIRVPREAQGCADELVRAVMSDELKGMLVVSPPGMGKTTMLRDIARQLSDRGYNIAIADERREIAACIEGIPGMDVGSRTDVMDGCPKAVAIPLLVRACAPDAVIADEIGTAADAQALLDAARCGVRVIASAHGSSYREVRQRRSIAPALDGQAFDYCAVLGPEPGKIKYLCKCTDEEPEYAEGNTVVHRSVVVRGNRTSDVQCQEKAYGCAR